MKKARVGIKTIVITLLMVFSTSCFSLVFVNAYKSITKKQPQAANDFYDFSTSSLVINDDGSCIMDDNTYNNYNTYTISDVQGLKRFAGTVRGNTFNGGRTYKDKIVQLKSNLDLQGESFSIGWTNDALIVIGDRNRPFSGTFDGGGWTITNIKITSYCTVGSYTYSGFFAILTRDAKIQNLRLLNVEIDSSAKIVGGIVGLASQAAKDEAYISNCWVENLTVKNANAQYLGGILGVNEGRSTYPGVTYNSYMKIEDCYVDNIKLNGQTTILYSANIGPAWGHCVTVDGAMGDEVGNSDFSGAYLKRCVVKNGFATVGSDYFCYSESSKSDCYNNPGYYPRLETRWINEEYPKHNNGYPYLEIFTKWYYLQENVDGEIREGKDNIKFLGGDYEMAGPHYAEVKISGNSLTIFGYTVTATPDVTVRFIRWEEGAVHDTMKTRRYIAVFESVSCTLNFSGITKNGVTWNPNINSVKVLNGSKIVSEAIYYKEYMRVVYNIYNISNELTATVVYNVENNIYAVDSFGNINGKEAKDLIISVTSNSTFTITPTVKLKSYNITFG